MVISNHKIGEIFGYVNSGINTILFIPQVILIYKTKNTKSISPFYLFLELLSSITNLIYGILINEYPIIISSGSIMLCTLFIAYGKFFFVLKNLNLKTPLLS